MKLENAAKPLRHFINQLPFSQKEKEKVITHERKFFYEIKE